MGERIVKHKRIRELCEDHDYTQAKIGEKIHVPQRTYAYYESGERMVLPPVVVHAGRFSPCKCDDILERTDNPKTNR